MQRRRVSLRIGKEGERIMVTGLVFWGLALTLLGASFFKDREKAVRR